MPTDKAEIIERNIVQKGETCFIAVYTRKNENPGYDIPPTSDVFRTHPSLEAAQQWLIEKTGDYTEFTKEVLPASIPGTLEYEWDDMAIQRMFDPDVE